MGGCHTAAAPQSRRGGPAAAAGGVSPSDDPHALQHSTPRSNYWIFCPPEVPAFINFARPNVYENYLQGPGRRFAADPSLFNY